MDKNLQTTAGDYADLLHNLKERIRAAQVRASLSVNRELVLLYWQIGRDILARQEAQGWGSKVIDRLAADLRKEFPEMKGFSPRNLKYMRAIAEAWPDAQFVQQAAAQIPPPHRYQFRHGHGGGPDADQTQARKAENKVIGPEGGTDMFKRIGCIVVASLILAAGLAIAAEDLGAKIYPGATKDEQWSKVQAEAMKASGGGIGVCYRTKDPVAKVAEFYQKDGFKLSPGQVTLDGAMLQKGGELTVTIKHMKPLDSTNDTRFCIGKRQQVKSGKEEEEKYEAPSY